MFKNAINKNNRISFWVTLFVCCFILCFHFTLPKYMYSHTKDTDWDILSYYLYLPQFFIHHDIAIKDYSVVQHLFDQYHFSPVFYQAAKEPGGNWVMIYTMGMAMLYLPFFLVGHVWASVGGYATDGFSFPYQCCVSSGMMIYILTGIFILRKILLRFFSDKITAIVVLLLCLGTNYFREAADYNMGPHGTLFMFYCLLIYYTIKWHETPKVKYAAVMGIAMGFLMLIRPSELICMCIPLLWNVYNKQSVLDKLTILKQNWKQLLVLVMSLVIVGIPQMMYWKKVTGKWVYNSYWNQNSFDIHNSNLINILISFRKGWFVYTPMIVFAFIGFYFLMKQKVFKSQLAVLFFISVNIFLLAHVPIWWNAGSLGQRFMVQSYSLLVFPFAAFIQFIASRKLIVKLMMGSVCFLLVLLNFFQTWQLTNWIIRRWNNQRVLQSYVFKNSSNQRRRKVVTAFRIC